MQQSRLVARAVRHRGEVAAINHAPAEARTCSPNVLLSSEPVQRLEPLMCFPAQPAKKLHSTRCLKPNPPRKRARWNLCSRCVSGTAPQ